MKKFIFAIAIFTSGLCIAQNNNTIIPVQPIEQSKFSLGIVGGFGHSFVVPYQDYTFNASWNAGLSAVFSPWTHWGIGMDAVYSSEGSALQRNDVTYNYQLDYIRVPIKAIYFFNTYERDFRPKITLGPSLGFLVNEVNSTNAATFDLGANLSVGFNYRLMRAVWFNADVNYYQGFLDTYSGNSLNEMNGNVRLNLGLSFGF